MKNSINISHIIGHTNQKPIGFSYDIGRYHRTNVIYFGSEDNIDKQGYDDYIISNMHLNTGSNVIITSDRNFRSKTSVEFDYILSEFDENCNAYNPIIHTELPVIATGMRLFDCYATHTNVLKKHPEFIDPIHMNVYHALFDMLTYYVFENNAIINKSFKTVIDIAEILKTNMEDNPSFISNGSSEIINRMTNFYTNNRKKLGWFPFEVWKSSTYNAMHSSIETLIENLQIFKSPRFQTDTIGIDDILTNKKNLLIEVSGESSDWNMIAAMLICQIINRRYFIKTFEQKTDDIAEKHVQIYLPENWNYISNLVEVMATDHHYEIGISLYCTNADYLNEFRMNDIRLEMLGNVDACVFAVSDDTPESTISLLRKISDKKFNIMHGEIDIINDNYIKQMIKNNKQTVVMLKNHKPILCDKLKTNK